MSNTKDITSLPGYEELQQAAIDALQKRADDEPSYIFEEGVDVSLGNLLEDHRKGQSQFAWSGHEILEALFDGRYHDAVQQMEEQWHSDGNWERDRDWTREQLKEALGDELEDAVQAFCEQHELDEDDVHEALKEDDEVQPEGGLHYSSFRFHNQINFKVDLDVTVGLEPSKDLVLALARLGIPAEEWLRAIEGSVEKDPPDDEDAFAKLFNAEDLAGYRESFGKCQVMAASHNVFLPSGTERQLVSPEKLVELYRGDWSGYSGDLHVCFKLDEDFINNVSKGVSRLSSGKDASDAAPISIHGAHLLPGDGLEYVDGCELSGSFICRLGDLRFANKDIDLPEVSTRLEGPLGLQSFIDSELLKADERLNRQSTGEFYATAVGRSHRGQEALTADLASPPILHLMSRAFKGRDIYEMDRCAGLYPGLSSYFEDAFAKAEVSVDKLGQQLIDLLKVNTGKALSAWMVSEDRMQALWLVQKGASLDMRLDGKSTEACGPTALHLAAALADHDLCLALIERGADPKATFPMPGDDAKARQGLWEIIARKAIANEEGGRNQDLAICVRDMALWAESQGALPLNFEQFSPRGIRVDTWRCLAALNERKLSQSHIERIVAIGHADFSDEHLRRAMHFALCRPSPSIAIPLIDAGVSIDAPSPDHEKSGLSIRQAATNWRSNVASRAAETAEEFDSIIQYAESKNALDLIRRIARGQHPKPN